MLANLALFIAELIARPIKASSLQAGITTLTALTTIYNLRITFSKAGAIRLFNASIGLPALAWNFNL